jgi:membrane protein implicated in regulation of membrane protease activity
METWWQSLTVVNKAFAMAALFFSLMFIWQLVAMLLGMHADSHLEADHGGMGHGDMEHGASDSHADAGIAFTLVSVRSVLAFATLFFWAGTLYLMSGISFVAAIAYSFIWGLVAMVLVAYVVYKLVQLQEIGTASVWSAIGEEGVVYMDIPADGTGKIRVMVSGVISFVSARSRGGEAIQAGTKVKVVAVPDNNTLEVVGVEDDKGE